jgi:hypothetical protein
MTRCGAKDDSIVWWCKKHHGIKHLYEMSTFEIKKIATKKEIF